MPGPTLSPAEIAQLTKEKAKAEAAAATYSAAVAGQAARAAELAVSDGAFKKFFDYYNDNIIGKYDLERRWINGYTLTSPVVEADIISCASLAGGRIQPALPVTDVIRISQFDGTPFTTNVDNENQHIIDQAAFENGIANGYGGTDPAATILTNTSITPSSTTLQLKDLTTTFSLAPNAVYVVTDGGSNIAVFKILTFVMQVSPVPPPYIADLTIQLLVAPAGTITSGKQLKAFNGFNNTERTTKTAATAGYQPLMNYFVSSIQSKVNSRITALNNQLAAIAANQDPEPGTELTTAATNANTSKTFLTNYLVTTDVSNTGLSSLSTERGVRSGQNTTRVTQIINAYTTRTKNYYNERYNAANNRANTSRGSLRLQKNAEQVSAASAGFAATLTAQAGAIGDILP